MEQLQAASSLVDMRIWPLYRVETVDATCPSAYRFCSFTTMLDEHKAKHKGKMIFPAQKKILYCLSPLLPDIILP